MNGFDGLAEAIVDGDQEAVVELVREALGAGLAPTSVLDAMAAAMDEVGDRFQCGVMFVPEMLQSARAMKAGTALLEPILLAAGVKPLHRAVVGTVAGDVHDIGKNLVAMMWKSGGIDVVDLGVNVPPQRFVDAAIEHDVALIGVSALLTTTMPNMRGVIDAVRAANLPVKVLVGGAPVTSEFAAQIGADGYAPDAGAAVDLARTLLAR
jgi:5-methyltetrahydrofolate--homocysteine methyltransferase